jgi:hypothetical protein
MEFKMAATAGLGLTLDPIGKNVSKRFFSWVFYADPKSKMAATTGHSINTGPYGTIQKYFLL